MKSCGFSCIFGIFVGEDFKQWVKDFGSVGSINHSQCDWSLSLSQNQNHSWYRGDIDWDKSNAVDTNLANSMEQESVTKPFLVNFNLSHVGSSRVLVVWANSKSPPSLQRALDLQVCGLNLCRYHTNYIFTLPKTIPTSLRYPQWGSFRTKTRLRAR